METNRKLLVGTLLCALFLFSFTKIKLGAIRGQVIPADAVMGIYLIKGTDTISRNTASQNFTFPNLKQGVYALLIKGKNNYRDSLIKNVAVKDSSTTDMGSIKLVLQ